MPTMLMYLIRSSDDCESSVVNRTQVFDADFLDTIPINFIGWQTNMKRKMWENENGFH